MSDFCCRFPDTSIFFRAMNLELWLMTLLWEMSSFLLRRKSRFPPRSFSCPLCTTCIVGHSHMLLRRLIETENLSLFPHSFTYLCKRERRASNFQGPHCLSKHVSAFRRASTDSSWTYYPLSNSDGFQLLRGTTSCLIVIIIVSSICLTKHCRPFWPQTSH